MVVVVALIPGMAGCDGGGDGPYTLNITSTAGGYVYSPGEGIFDYDSGTVVDLVAVADEGYIFSHWGGDVSNIDNILDKETSISIFSNYRIRAVFFELAPMVAAGWDQTVGLTSGSFPFACGTVVATNGYNYSSWTDIVQVAVGYGYYVGRKSDGTVVSTSSDDFSSWADITQLSASGGITVGLKSDGTVVAVGYLCDVGEWNSAVSSWTHIMQVAAGGIKGFAVGLTNTGTVVNTGGEDCSSWTDITQVSAGGEGGFVVGLTNTGTVVNTGGYNCSSWTDIIQVSAGGNHIVGLKSDGTVVAVGSNSSGQLNVGSWDLIP